jgi:hypothetical protein
MRFQNFELRKYIRRHILRSPSVCGKWHRRLHLDVRSSSFLGLKEGCVVGAGAEPGVMDFSGPHWDGPAFPKYRKCELIRDVPVRGIVFLVDLSIQCNQCKSNVNFLFDTRMPQKYKRGNWRLWWASLYQHFS